jgi:hypothetical protein
LAQMVPSKVYPSPDPQGIVPWMILFFVLPVPSVMWAVHQEAHFPLVWKSPFG